MPDPNWRYCLIGGNFTTVGQAGMGNFLATGGGLAMWDRMTERWSILGGHSWSSSSEIYAIKTIPVYDRVTFKYRTVSFVGGYFTELVSPTVNVTGSGTTVYNLMIHNGNEWERTSFNYGFDRPVHAITMYKTLQNCEETIQACSSDLYVAGAFSSTADYSVPTRRVAVGRYSDREYVQSGISTFVIKYTWSYISSNNVGSTTLFARALMHCGGFLFVGGNFDGGVMYTNEFNTSLTASWTTVSTGLDGEVTSLECVPQSADGVAFGALHVGGTFTADDGLISLNMRYHVTTTTNTAMDWIQVGRTPNKLSFSCFRCTGEPLPLGYPVSAIKVALHATGAYYDVAVAAHNKIYKYTMGTHPHEVSPTEVIIQNDVGGAWSDGRIRTVFISGVGRGARARGLGMVFVALLAATGARAA